MATQASSITIYQLNGVWRMDARGAFGGGFSGAALQGPGHAAALIGRYNTNPLGCSVYVEDRYKDAAMLRAMASA